MANENIEQTNVKWKRPENVPYPQIYHKFEGKKEIDGVIPKFWVQDLPEEDFEKALNVMKTEFLISEPTSKCSKLVNDEVSVESLVKLWKEGLKDRIVLACYMENPDSTAKPMLAGLNWTIIQQENNLHDLKIQGRYTKKLIFSMEYISKIVNCFEIMNTNVLLGALGLYVLDDFHGQNVGFNILQAREPLCKAMSIKGTVTAFTSVIAQRIAERAGFILAAEISYEDLPKVIPIAKFPNIEEHSKSMKYMYKMYN